MPGYQYRNDSYNTGDGDREILNRHCVKNNNTEFDKFLPGRVLYVNR